MVARGEISLLIVNVARESSPDLMPDQLFYLVIWATLLCTIIGPVVVGVIVKRLEKQGGMLPATWGPQAGETSVLQQTEPTYSAPAAEDGSLSNTASTVAKPAEIAKKAIKASKEGHKAVPQRL
jgi:hypothetical protein